jgi:uncharacterized membrane protein
MNKEKKKGEADLTELGRELREMPADEMAAMVGILHHQVTSFHGPLPPPEVLKQYDETIPGAAERILSMAEKQQDHRSKLELMIVEKRIHQSAIGQIFGFILALVFGGISFGVALIGYPILAGTLGCSTILGLAVIFVLGKKPALMKQDEEKDVTTQK